MTHLTVQRPKKQSALVTAAQTTPFQIKTLPILQDADATELTERSGFVDCQTSPVKQLQSESVSDTIGKGKEELLSNLEEKLATSLLRCKQNSSADKHIVSYKTGGLRLTYMRIPKSRKPVSKSMQPKRNRVMESARSAMAGTSNQQLLAQHKAELKRLNSLS